jgi:hypothetical protein
MTRTHTVYFGDEQLKGLRTEMLKLEKDFGERELFVSLPARKAGKRRLAGLRAAIELLSEPVPESYE